MENHIHYLALGDSYTIGEGVPIHQSFPYQLIQLLRKKKGDSFHFHAPEIIAQTGWTTDELMQNILSTQMLPKYNFVTLLIGVNNQYRGRSSENYKEEFELLLKKAISFSGNHPEKVFVLSIPDWGVTPFAAEKDSEKIAREIDDFNEVCKNKTNSLGCNFIDITNNQRKDGNKDEFLASDKLHPSAKEYEKWANELFLLLDRAN